MWGRTSGLEDGAAGGARTPQRERPSPKARSAHPKLPFLPCDTGMPTPPGLRHFRGLGRLHAAEAPGQCRARSESYSFIFQVKNETGKRRIILKYRRSGNRLIDTEDKVIVARWKGLGGWMTKGQGLRSTNGQSPPRGRKARRRKRGRCCSGYGWRVGPAWGDRFVRHVSVSPPRCTRKTTVTSHVNYD